MAAFINIQPALYHDAGLTIFTDSATSSRVVIWQRERNSPAARTYQERHRQEERRRKLQAYLALLEARFLRAEALARTLALTRRERPTRERKPHQEPRARATSGAGRWRVRNPNL